MGVFAMLYGTERGVSSASGIKPHERTSEHDQSAEPSPLLNLASIGAFSVGFGITGYLVATETAWPLWTQIGVAVLAGGVALALQAMLFARWAIPAARAEHVDERYLLQGTLARIVGDVPAHGQGTLVYALDNREFELGARDIDDAAIASGTDVVIDRVEGGVAYVELWSRVEERL